MGQCFSIADCVTGRGRNGRDDRRDARNKGDRSMNEGPEPHETQDTDLQESGVLRAEPPYLWENISLERGSQERIPLKIILSNGLVVSISTRSDNTFNSVNIIVQSLFGRQPEVHVRGQRFPPTLMAMHKGQWVPIHPAATVEAVGQADVKYALPEDAVRFSPKDATASWRDVTIFSSLWSLRLF